MKGYIADTMLNQLFDAIDNGKPLSRDIANSVAMGMKKWASELGATHYTHWFQPLTGLTAEELDDTANVHESRLEKRVADDLLGVVPVAPSSEQQ